MLLVEKTNLKISKCIIYTIIINSYKIHIINICEQDVILQLTLQNKLPI
jgi:hypothetical protein